MNKDVNGNLILGDVPRIEFGDVINFRHQMAVVGGHEILVQLADCEWLLGPGEQQQQQQQMEDPSIPSVPSHTDNREESVCIILITKLRRAIE